MSSFFIKYRQSWQGVFLATVSMFYILICFSLSDFIHTPVHTLVDLLLLLSHWGIIGLPLFGVISIAMQNRYVYSVFILLIGFLSSILAYFRIVQNFSLNTMIFNVASWDNLFVTLDLISWPLCLYVLFSIVIGIVLIFQRFKFKIRYSKFTLVWNLLSIFLVYYFVFYNYRFVRPISERIPFNLYSTFSKYQKEKQVANTKRDRTFQYAISNQDSLTVVVVLGESLRPQNLSINGYYRNTTPLLITKKVVSLPYITTEYTYTNRSIPHILTRADSTNTERAYTERSFIDVFKQANFKTYYLSNQDSEYSYIFFAQEADVMQFVNKSKNSYNFEKWLDEDLFSAFYDALSDRQTSQKLIILHTIGSHWWYNSHYSAPFERYTPVMKSRIISQCDSMEIVNSYDNTVLYTDHFVAQLIRKLHDQNAILLYISDHGEALGENDVWLHAQEVDVLKRTAAFVWMSELYKTKNPDKVRGVERNKEKHYSTDFFFHTVIDAANIKTDILSSDLSAFK